MRFLADIPDDDVAWLDRRAADEGRSRAALVREAVAIFRIEHEGGRDAERRRACLEAGFGAWKDRTDIGDTVEWQRRERAGWTRPWDDDYEEVKAEFPDLFKANDDREREHYLHLLKVKENADDRKQA